MIQRLFLLCVLLISVETFAQEPILSKTDRALPGINPTPFLQYSDPAARAVEITGTWNMWSNRYPLKKQGDVWVIDVRPLALKAGRHEYKFIVNGVWETGENREFYIDDNHVLVRPPNVVMKALRFCASSVSIRCASLRACSFAASVSASALFSRA